MLSSMSAFNILSKLCQKCLILVSLDDARDRIIAKGATIKLSQNLLVYFLSEDFDLLQYLFWKNLKEQ